MRHTEMQRKLKKYILDQKPTDQKKKICIADFPIIQTNIDRPVSANA